MKGTGDDVDVQVQLVDIPNSSSATNGVTNGRESPPRESSKMSGATGIVFDIHFTLQKRNIKLVSAGPFDDMGNNAALQLFYVLAAEHNEFRDGTSDGDNNNRNNRISAVPMKILLSEFPEVITSQLIALTSPDAYLVSVYEFCSVLQKKGSTVDVDESDSPDNKNTEDVGSTQNAGGWYVILQSKEPTIPLGGWNILGHWVVNYKALLLLYHPPHSQYHSIT